MLAAIQLLILAVLRTPDLAAFQTAVLAVIGLSVVVARL